MLLLSYCNKQQRNIKGLGEWVAKLKELENQSLWQKLGSFHEIFCLNWWTFKNN